MINRATIRDLVEFFHLYSFLTNLQYGSYSLNRVDYTTYLRFDGNMMAFTAGPKVSK